MLVSNMNFNVQEDSRCIVTLSLTTFSFERTYREGVLECIAKSKNYNSCQFLSHITTECNGIVWETQPNWKIGQIRQFEGNLVLLFRHRNKGIEGYIDLTWTLHAYHTFERRTGLCKANRIISCYKDNKKCNPWLCKYLFIIFARF
jgi:hypothetical protein